MHIGQTLIWFDMTVELGSCKATLHAACADGSSVTAVDMRLPGYVVTKKATA